MSDAPSILPMFRAWLLCAYVAASVTACAPAARPTLRTPASGASAPRARALGVSALPGPQPAPALGGVVQPELFVRCEDRASCPDAVGMLVVDVGVAAPPERCTVTLIDKDRVLTASHCLAASDRRAGATCTRTWVAFPQTADAPAEWIACGHVVAATAVVDESALHQEHAILQLAHASARVPLAVDPTPPEPGSIVMVVSVTPHPVYGSTHALSTRLCRAIDSTPAERALGRSAANVGWLASCPIAHGNSGSPVLDYQGHIRAIVHGGTSLTSAFGVTSALSD